MALTAAEHRQIQTAKKAARNQFSREKRASGGPVYRKVPVVVGVLETVTVAGAPLMLVTSDAPNERGRYFEITVESGRWRCACGAFLSLGGCHHVGWLAQQTGQAGQAGQAH